jgi:hypothetical protein
MKLKLPGDVAVRMIFFCWHQKELGVYSFSSALLAGFSVTYIAQITIPTNQDTIVVVFAVLSIISLGMHMWVVLFSSLKQFRLFDQYNNLREGECLKQNAEHQLRSLMCDLLFFFLC